MRLVCLEDGKICYNYSGLLVAYIDYKLGYLLKNEGIYHEKGVDVHIAVDILVAAYERLYDRILLVSSDTDLIPAIEKAKEKGVPVEYIGFLHKPSVAMVQHCTESTLLGQEQISPHVS